MNAAMQITQYASLPTGFVVDYQHASIFLNTDRDEESPFTDAGLVRAYMPDEPSTFHEYAARKLARDKPFAPIRQKLRDLDVEAFYLPLPLYARRGQRDNYQHLTISIDSFVMVLTDKHKAALFKLWLPTFNSGDFDRLGLA